MRLGKFKTINYIVGYRTRRSMKNQQTWDYAHRECGLLWRRWGSTMLVLTVIAMLLFMGEDTDHIGVVGSVITVLQMIPLFLSIVIVEKKLRENLMRTAFRGDSCRKLYPNKKAPIGGFL